jgi:DNA ligase D-like protein (predicted ligase)
MERSLPEFVPPMLAKPGEPFDSDEYLFEIKWDGIRALAFVEPDGYRLIGRNRTDFRPRYPELAFLADLEPGTLLDGEIVVLEDGRPDFSAVMSREHSTSPRRIEVLSRTTPVTFIVFDLLHDAWEPLVEHSLAERRAALERIVAGCGDPHLVFSDGVVGGGVEYFDQVTTHGFEGVVAKRLDSPYEPGRRTGAWTKMKKVHTAHCVIVGFEPDGEDDLKSLVIALLDDGELRCVGKVGSGLTHAMRRRLNGLLRERERKTPLIDTGIKGRWVEPEFYCKVSYLERTREGNLRAPVFLGLVEAS